MVNFFKFLLPIFLSLTASAVYAQQTLAPEKSELRFSGKQMNVAQDGKFKKFTASQNAIKFDLFSGFTLQTEEGNKSFSTGSTIKNSSLPPPLQLRFS